MAPPTEASPQSVTAEPAEKEHLTVKQKIFAGLGFLSLGIGVVGIFVPILPTTEFVMLAAFLFAKSSPRFHKWLLETKVYKTYVQPFKEKGGLPKRTKAKMLIMSFAVLGVSAALVRIWYVWLILGLVAAMMLWLLLIHVPTRSEEN